MDKLRLVIEVVGDELVATTGTGQIYRKQWEYDGNELSPQVAAFAREHVDEATHLAVVGPRLMADDVLGVSDAIAYTTVVRDTLQGLLANTTVELATAAGVTSAWLTSATQQVYWLLQQDQTLRFDSNGDLSVVLVNLTETDVLLQHSVVRNCRLAECDNWPTFMPAERYIDAVSFLTARVKAADTAGVAIVFAPHPCHTAYGYHFQRAARLGFGSWDKPVAMFSDALAVRTGVDILSREQVG